MAVVDRWTGRSASALRSALRMTSEAFADHLGAGVRTVKYWDQRPQTVLSEPMQETLDAALDQAPDSARDRFALLLSAAAEQGADIDPAAPAALTVGIAVVTTPSEALLVCRRDDENSGLTWQFPAGIVKPGGAPDKVAIAATLAETGVHCVVAEHLGQRRHPLTHAICHYFHCEYLAGEASNLDIEENASVLWVRRIEVTRFIPEDMIYAPVLRKLMEGSEHAAS